MVDMCADCGVFYDKTEFVVTDLTNYIVKQKRIYKKLDHFKEVLGQFQGREGKIVPKEVLQQIRSDLADKFWVKPGGEITHEDVKKSLRRLKLRKYVENSFYICHALSGKDTPYIKKDTEEKMIKQFRQIENAYCSVKGWFARRSFLNYYYIIYKLLDLLKQDDLLPKIPLLKTKLRLRQHDAIWNKICDELGWTFRPTQANNATNAIEPKGCGMAGGL